MQKRIENKPENIWPHITAAISQLFRDDYFSWLSPPLHPVSPKFYLAFGLTNLS